MSILRRLLPGGNDGHIVHIARRFLSVFAAHGIERAQIPRWIPGVRYKDLQNEAKLLAALTPQVLDTTVELFGLELGWLEGTSSLALLPQGERGNPLGLLDRIAATVRASEAASIGWNPAPLRVLTDVDALNRNAPQRQWLVLVIVQAVGDRGDGPKFRRQVHSYPFDWSRADQRLELKAITWLVHNRLRTVVPLYRIQSDQLENILGGHEIPGMVLNRSIITEPSLDDYIHDASSSRVAKEVDELGQVLDLLDTLRLRDYSFVGTPLPIAEQVPSPADIPEVLPAAAPKEGGKRQTQQSNWIAIAGAAQTLWTQAPGTTIAGVIGQLKRMPHLKASALSDSAIHKRIAPLAPEGVRAKPGRKPKQSP